MKKILLLLMVISISACAITDNGNDNGDNDGGGSTTDYNQLWKDRVANKAIDTASFDNNANFSYLAETYTFDSSTELGRGIYKKGDQFFGILAGKDITKLLSITSVPVADSADIDWNVLIDIVVPDYKALWIERVSNKSAGISSFDNTANLTYITDVYNFDSSAEVGRGIYEKDSLYYGVIASEDFTTTLSMTTTGVSDSATINWENVKNITASTPDPDPDPTPTVEELFKTAIQTMTGFYGQTISVDTDGKFTAKGTNYTYVSVKNATQAVYSVGGTYQYVGIAIVNNEIKLYQDNKMKPWYSATDVKFDSKYEFGGFIWGTASSPSSIPYNFERIYIKIVNNEPHVLYRTDAVNHAERLSLRKPLKNWEEIANGSGIDSGLVGHAKFITDKNNIYLSTEGGRECLYKKEPAGWTYLTKSTLGLEESLSVYNNIPYVSYTDAENYIYRIYLNNRSKNDWKNLAVYKVNSERGIEISDTCIYIQDQDNIYVSYYQEHGNINSHKVLKWNGSEFLPPLEVSSGRETYLSDTSFTIYNKKLYAISVNNLNKITIKSTTGLSWQDEIVLDTPDDFSGYPKLKLYNNAMYVFVRHSDGLYVYKYQNNTLETLKFIPGFSHDEFDMEISDTGILYLIHSIDDTGTITMESTQL